MTPQERQSVSELFDRLAQLENTPRDAEAERAIADGLMRAPHAVYALVQTTLDHDPLSGHVFVFRGRRGDLIKVLWRDDDGLCLMAKRLDRGRFVWPKADSGTVSLTRAQLSMLCEGIDWRRVERTAERVMAI